MGRLWLVPSVVVAALVVLGPLLSHLEWVDPEFGFRLYLSGVVLAAVSAGICGGAAAVATALGRSWRPRALRAAILPLLIAIVSIAPGLGGPRWPFNDVSTDLEDAPTFVTGPAAGVSYPPEFAVPQRKTFPEIEGPIRLALPPSQSVRWAEQVARSMPAWEIVHVDPAEGRVQAVAVSRVFRFRDDVIVRVRPDGGGSRVAIRSRSRVGRSDLGANAARIRAFRDALLTRPGQGDG
jgi:uncharacterized protein (DUF1499 family)